MSKDTYEQLRVEWKEKVRSAKEKLRGLERNISRYLDNLDYSRLRWADTRLRSESAFRLFGEALE